MPSERIPARFSRRGQHKHPVIEPEQITRICEALKMGNYIETACLYAGIRRSTLHWYLHTANHAKKRMKTEDKPRLSKVQLRAIELLEAFEKAIAEAEVMDVNLIATAAGTQWQAAAWRLERRFPDRWALRGRVPEGEQQEKQREGDEGPTIEVVVERTAEEVKALQRAAPTNGGLKTADRMPVIDVEARPEGE